MALPKLLFGAVAAVVVVVWTVLLRPAFLGGPASYVIVSGASMEPTLRSGDLAVTQIDGSYSVGDVVAFRAEGSIVIHRIVGGGADEGYVVQGDNKPAPDQWRPKPNEILGRMWLHLPGAGHVIAALRQPLHLAATVAGLVLLAVIGGGEVKHRRKRGGRHVTAKSNGTIGQLPAPVGMLVAMGVLAVLGLAGAAGSVYAFRQPTEVSQYVERARYEHTAAFDYTAHMQPSTLYPDGVVGPITPPPPGVTTTVTTPIYAKLARSLDLGFTYRLEGSAPPDVGGELSADLQVSAGKDGWSKAQEILPPTPFSGPTASTRLTVELAPMWSMIETIEKETDFRAGSYEVAVTPRVHVKGRVGLEAIDEVYAPPFSVKLSRNQIVPDSQLVRSEVKQIGEAVTQPAAFNYAGLALPVATARWLSAALAALFLLAAGALAAAVFLGLGRGESGRVQARYGSMIVSVEQAYLKSQRVEVTSMQDLARLAERDGRTIFREKLGPEAERYFVPDGDVIYTYTPTPVGEEE